MNTCMLSGRLHQNAKMFENSSRVLSFVLVTSYGWDDEKKRERVAFVPCVVFNPEERLSNQLTKDGKDRYVECEGRINRSKLPNNGGYRTEVIVKTGTLTMPKV